MKILFSIILNAAILFIMAYLLWENIDKSLPAGIIVTGGWKTYVLGWIILGILNVTIRPLIKIVSFPLFFIFFGFIVFFVKCSGTKNI